MSPTPARPGLEAIRQKGVVRAHKWLIARRLTQLGIPLSFLLGPLAGIWIVKGNMASSLTLGVLPLADPYVLLQSLLSGHALETTAIVGGLIVLVFYVLVGGRVYCSWVCPINVVADLAGYLRRKLDLKGPGARLSRSLRYWILGLTLLLATATGSLVWELFNPVSMVFRGIIFGMGFAWVFLLAVLVFDLFVSRRGWCGHLCPVGAFYGLLGAKSPLRMSAPNRAQCDDCMDCFAVCPEPHVIKPALKGAGKGMGPVITSGDCTNCARCIDVCTQDVFHFDLRHHNMPESFANQGCSGTPTGSQSS